MTPETVPAVDGVVAEFTASLADIEKGSSSLAQPRPPLSFFLISLSFDKKGESCSFLLFVLILKIVKECDQTRFWTLKKRQNNYMYWDQSRIIVVCQLSSKTMDSIS